MTLTDEELTGLIAARFGDGSLPAGLAQVERRGRQRRRRARVAVAAAAVIGLAGLGGVTAYGLDRLDEAERAAALNRSCQSAYTAEAAGTGRAAQLPAELGEPVLELRRGDARFRLYTSAPGPLRFMLFDCARMADGSVSGRISYGPATAAGLEQFEQPLTAYRDHLPDGTVAIVAQLGDPAGVLTVTPAHADVQTAQRDRLAVVWGPAAALADGTLSVGDSRLDLARDALAVTATFQEAEFDRYCMRALARRPDLSAALPALTAGQRDTWALRLYRAEKAVALCSWTNLADDPDNGVSYHGPSLAFGSATNMVPGSILASVGRQQAWLTGLTLPGTEQVEVVAEDGTRVRAQLGDGVYLALLPGSGKHETIIMTTATTVHTFANGGNTQRPR